MKVERIAFSEARPWILKRHYAHRTPTGRAYGLFQEGILVGVCVYSSVITHHVAPSICGEKYQDIVTELSRLVVEEGLEKNTLSKFVSETFKLLETPRIILSYSDSNQGHHGYIYQALNFIYTGEGGSPEEYILKGKQVSTRPEGLRKQMKIHDGYREDMTIAENVALVGGEVRKLKRKHRYVYFLGNKREKKALRKALRFESLPYPKGDNVRYDAGGKLDVQLRLI